MAPTHPTPNDPAAPGGLYLHIPFCRSKCAYCDFHSSADLQRLPDVFEALLREVRLRASESGCFDSIYLGGGTPSLLAGGDVARLLTHIRRHFPILPDAEITLEGNPDSLTPARLTAYRQAGINRLSIGVQSFHNARLRFLERRHNADQSQAAIRSARRAGFTNISLDLIYGLPGQSEQDWRRELEIALASEPEHLSCYQLTIEPGTRLALRHRRGEWQALDEAAQLRLFRLTREHLAAAGYDAYEISNFARRTPHGGANLRSRHNQKYWNHLPYIGLGPAAHSFQPPLRSWNEMRLQPYIDCLARDQLPVAGSERLTPRQMRIETLYLALRQSRGLDRDAYARRFGERFEARFARPLAQLMDGGQLVWTPPCYQLTEKGFAVADGVVAHLVSALAEDEDLPRPADDGG